MGNDLKVLHRQKEKKTIMLHACNMCTYNIQHTRNRQTHEKQTKGIDHGSLVISRDAMFITCSSCMSNLHAYAKRTKEKSVVLSQK